MKHFGYWVFGKDMYNVKLETLKKIGVTDVFLNYYAVTVYGQSKVAAWIKQAKNNGMNVHIWVQCFYDGEWHNPKTMNLTSKLNEIKKYAGISGVYGIHLDYLRYPGNAYKTAGGADAITAFVKKVRSQNPKTFLSCAVMPETECKKYYGQDIDALGKILDCIIPMQYKGNYDSGTSWLASTTKYFASKATIWSGLQAYKSDDDTTLLTAKELENDVKTCLNNGAKGAILFRYGLAHAVNFKQFQTTTSTSKATISTSIIKEMARITKAYIEKQKKIPSQVTVNNKKYDLRYVIYILAHSVVYPGKSVTLFQAKNAPNPTGDKISEKLYQKDYTDVAKRVIAYMKTKKICPNFARTTASKKRLNLDVLVYMLARIVNYYYTKKKMPSYAIVSSNFFKKSEPITPSDGRYISSPHFLEEGAGYLGQITPSTCGPHSCRQALKKLGVVVSESTLASWAGTVEGSGTDHEGINTAIAKAAKDAGVNIDVTWYNFSSLGNNDAARFKKLGELISQKNVAGFLHILYSGSGDYYNPDEEYGHYEPLDRINIQTKYVRALNSLGSRDGYGYYGHLQDRTFDLQSKYISGISQKSVCILRKK